MFLKSRVLLTLIPILLATSVDNVEEISNKKVSSSTSRNVIPQDENDHVNKVSNEIYETSIFPKEVGNVMAEYTYSPPLEELKNTIIQAWNT